MSVQVDVAVSSMPDIGNAVAYLRWIGVLRVVGAALVALGVGLELVGEVLGHPSEQTLRAGREAEIAELTARVEGLQRAMQASPAPCRIETTATDVTPVQACPVPSD